MCPVWGATSNPFFSTYDYKTRQMSQLDPCHRREARNLDWRYDEWGRTERVPGEDSPRPARLALLVTIYNRHDSDVGVLHASRGLRSTLDCALICIPRRTSSVLLRE